MKLIIDVEKDYYEMLKYNVEHGQEYKPFEIIANGIHYEERPQGKWISDYRSCKCSFCNFTTVIDTYNYCPNCGADMRKGSEEE